MSAPLLKLDQLAIGYRGITLSSPMTTEIPSESAVGIIGANGSGKSTLIKTLAGLLNPLSGSYHWRAATRFGYVPQEDQLNPLLPLTVMDLLQMGWHERLPRWGFLPADFKEAASVILDEMEMAPFAGRLVSELSRGQRQRALIARALMVNPDVLLLDEPYSALDDVFRKKLYRLFSEKKKKSGFSYFIIEHDLNRVINQVDWVILLGQHETLCGSKADIINESALSKVYESKLHLHEGDGEIQIHFL